MPEPGGRGTCLIDVYRETTSMVISTEFCVKGRFCVPVRRSVELMSVDGCFKYRRPKSEMDEEGPVVWW